MINLSMSSVSSVLTVIVVLCKESFRRLSVIIVTESKKKKIWECLILLNAYTYITQNWLVYRHARFTWCCLYITHLWTQTLRAFIPILFNKLLIRFRQIKGKKSSFCFYIVNVNLELVLLCKYWHSSHLFDILVTDRSVQNFPKV